MGDPDQEREAPRRFSTGTSVCLIVALLSLVLSGYFLLAPLQVSSGTHAFDCGSIISGPSTTFAKGICGSTPAELAKARAAAFLVTALLVAGGGFLIFGLPRSTRTSRRGRRRRAEVDPDDSSHTSASA